MQKAITFNDTIFINILNDVYLVELMFKITIEKHALKNINNCLYTNIYSYLETSGGISYNPYLSVVHLSTPELIRHL